MAKLEQDVKGHELDDKLLKEFCIVDEQMADYKSFTRDLQEIKTSHKIRENMPIQDIIKLGKAVETKFHEARIAHNEERTQGLVAEHNVEQLISETSDIESERNSIMFERDHYEKLAQERQELSAQVKELTTRCREMECDLSKMCHALQVAKEELRKESSKNLIRVVELTEANSELRNNAEQSMQKSIVQGQEMKSRIAELENVLEETRQFYQEREVKAESTRQQQTNLINYLQLQWEECIKKKILGEILGTKQENMPPVSLGMPVEYREIENQLIKEQAKVKALTDQILIGSASAPKSPTTPERESKKAECAIFSARAHARLQMPDQPNLLRNVNSSAKYEVLSGPSEKENVKKVAEEGERVSIKERECNIFYKLL